MATKTLHSSVWELVRRQFGVVSRAQLLELGFTDAAIKHRLATGRLHPVRRGVYAVGRSELTQFGRWMAVLLAVGPEAALSHRSATSLYGIAKQKGNEVHVSIPSHLYRCSSRDITIHRRRELNATTHKGIPTVRVEQALIDLAGEATTDELEAAINAADKRDLIDPETLRGEVAGVRRKGTARLKAVLTHHTPADSPLEREFLRLVKRAGLPRPQTQALVDGHRVDFFWPDLNLVVETDGLRYHRTPAEQAKDRARDQDHLVAGRTAVRFTWAQVRTDGGRVEAVLKAAAA
jgi:very-short-patch-repair endonuclease